MSRPDREPFSKDDAELALAVLLEPLAEGARVLWVGEPGAGAERLASTAASVEALAGPRRSRNGGRRTSTVRTRGIPAAGELWDLVVVPELEDESRVGEAVQWLDTRGALVVSTPASPASYERLETELGRLFGPGGARIVGQTRFAGFALVDFAQADGSDVAFDGTAVEDTEPPVRWLALAGPAALAAPLPPYLVVQTAAGEGAPASPAEPRAAERPAPDRGALEREVEAARARLEHAEKRLEQAQREIARSSQKLDELRHQLDEANAARAASVAELEAARRDQRALAQRVEAAEKNALSPAEAREIEEAYVELEARLKEQASELTTLRTELERRASLVRDLVEELAEARRGVTPIPTPATAPSAETLSELDRLRAQIAGLMRRVGDAEAQRAAAQFTADELRGRLERADVERQRAETERQRAEAERQRAETERARLASDLTTRPTAPPPTAPTGELAGAIAHARAEAQAQLASAFAEEREALLTKRAEADGRVRGLVARLAELDERRSLAEARVALLEADLAEAKRQARANLARLEETREQLELARIQPPGAPEDARREGELLGALTRTRETLLAAQEERDQLLRELTRVRASQLAAEQEAATAQSAVARDLGALRSEIEVLRATEATTRAALVELRGAHEARLGALDALEGERNGLTLRLADAEASLAALGSRLDALTHERDGLAAQLAESRGTLNKIAERSSDGTIAEGEAEDVAAQVALLEAEREETRRIGVLLGDVERDLEAIRRERDAETARANAAESAAQSERGEARKVGTLLGEFERDLEAIRRERDAASQALAAAREDERQRAASSIARLSARDALIARLQSELAAAGAQKEGHRRELAALEERLRREAEQRAAETAVQEVQRVEDVRERAALAEAVSEAKAHAEGLRRQREQLRELVGDSRASLVRLVEGLSAPDGRTAAHAPESILQGEIAALRRELDDRGLMLRSLTAQLEERDERLRALDGGAEGEARRALQAALAAAEEREARLVRELELAAERRTAAMEREAEVRRLEKELEGREGQVMSLEGRLEQTQRQEASLRDQLAKLGSELESVLARAGGEAPAATLERLGQLLRSLRR